MSTPDPNGPPWALDEFLAAADADPDPCWWDLLPADPSPPSHTWRIRKRLNHCPADCYIFQHDPPHDHRAFHVPVDMFWGRIPWRRTACHEFDANDTNVVEVEP